MIRRVISALVVALAFLSLAGSSTLSATPAITPAATEAPTAPARFGCSISLPSVVWVGRAHTPISASLKSDCALHGTLYASWDVRHSRYGASNIFIFDGSGTAANGFYDWERFGTYYVEPRNSWNADWDLTQNTHSYVVKSGSKIGVKPARLGKHVLLSVAATYYSPAERRYRLWPSARVSLQYRTCPTCDWKYLKSVRTAANGRATFTSFSPRTRYYRAVTSTSATIWGRMSAVTRR